jgi:glycosyltransferase involved in cell wall biosynthesis
MPRICIVPRVDGIGGMASFRLKFEAGLLARGIKVTYDLGTRADSVLIIGGTRHLYGLWSVKRRGVPIVHRLDGINWIHRARRTPPRLFVRSEAANLLLALIRARFADRVIYQSTFVKEWWESWYGATRAPSTVIYNGVDLTMYTSDGPAEPPGGRYRIMVVEGSLADGQVVGLPWAVRLAEALHETHGLQVELSVAAKVTTAQQEHWLACSRVPLTFLGVVPREHIPALDRSAHLYFSAELNPPCPNSVIEALACGLPVVGFDTGALGEIVTSTAGHVVPFGGDPWRLDAPDIPALAKAAAEVLADLPRYQIGARARAEQAFGLDEMMDKYLDVLMGGN